jgi:hypothetical protein
MHIYRMSFVVGLGVGYVLGTRAGRERYDQMVKMAQSTRENPQFQQATSTIQTQAASLLNTASQKVSEMAPQFAQTAQTAMHKVGDMTHRNGHGDSGTDSTGATSDSPFASTSNPTRPTNY